MSSHNVEKIILPIIHLSFLETVPELVWGITFHLLSDYLMRLVSISNPRIGTYDPGLVCQWSCFSLVTAQFTNVHLPQTDAIKMNSGILVETTRTKHSVSLSICISEYGSLELETKRGKTKPKLKDSKDII